MANCLYCCGESWLGLKKVVQKKSRRVFEAVVFCGLPELVHQIFEVHLKVVT